MAYDDKLANRIREVLGLAPGMSERKMFGGLAFMQQSHMFCGIVGDELMVRVGPARYEEALAEPHVRPMDFTGRPLTGYVFVAATGIRTKAALSRWVEWSLGVVAALPAKKPRKAASKRAFPKAGRRRP